MNQGAHRFIKLVANIPAPGPTGSDVRCIRLCPTKHDTNPIFLVFGSIAGVTLTANAGRRGGFTSSVGFCPRFCTMLINCCWLLTGMPEIATTSSSTLNPAAFAGRSASTCSMIEMIERIQIKCFQSERVVCIRRQPVGLGQARPPADTLMLNSDRKRVGEGKGGVGHDLVPGGYGLAVHGNNAIALLDALPGFRRGRINVANNGRIDQLRHANIINDRGNKEGEYDVHNRACHGHGNPGQRRRGRHIVRLLFPFNRAGSDHLGQLDVAAGRNPAHRIFDAIPRPPKNLWPKANGERLRPSSRAPGHPEMPEFMNKNGRAEQKDDAAPTEIQLNNV